MEEDSGRGADFEFACVHGAPPKYQQPSSDRSATRDGKSLISWRCNVCGYHMLAMDHRGQPLPLSRGPRGDILPVYCSRCDREHTDWSSASPFGAFGDHANLPAAFSNRVDAGVPLPIGSASSCGGDAMRPHPKDENTKAGRGGARSLVCGKCGRPLLRLDAMGHVVPLHRDTKGNVVPLQCPGCGKEHTEWILAPAGVPLKSIDITPAVGGRTRDEDQREFDILDRPVTRHTLF